MRTVTAAVANREFSKLLRAAQGGETVTITSRGHPVAMFGPATADAETQAAAHAALVEHLRAQPPTIVAPWTRDELYEDGPDA